MSGGEESFRPGTGPQPVFVPTQEDPVPLGLPPVSPIPKPEGSETPRHAQLFAYDASTNQFKPVGWMTGTGAQGSLSVSVDPLGPLIDTFITRDPVTRLVSLIAETDGVRTKNSIITRAPCGQVASVHEVFL